jgi:hypothetical protein
MVEARLQPLHLLADQGHFRFFATKLEFFTGTSGIPIVTVVAF